MTTNKLILFLFTLFIACNAAAQTKGKVKRGWLNNFIVAGVDYHLNGVDVDTTDFLKAKNSVGGRFGFAFERMTSNRIILSPSMQVRFMKQTLEIDYDLSRAGYNTTDRYTDEISFQNVNLDIKIQGGYSLLLNDQSALDICAGLVFDFPFTGKYEEILIYQEGLDPVYNELVSYRRTAWGNKKSDANKGTLVPANLLVDFNINYRLLEGSLFKDRSAYIGLSLVTLASGNFNNNTQLSFYGKDRKKISTASFDDRQLSLGLSMAIQI